MVPLLSRLWRDSRGVSAAEYALILAIVGAVIAISVFALGGAISASMNQSSSEIETCGGGC